MTMMRAPLALEGKMFIAMKQMCCQTCRVVVVIIMDVYLQEQIILLVSSQSNGDNKRLSKLHVINLFSRRNVIDSFSRVIREREFERECACVLGPILLWWWRILFILVSLCVGGEGSWFFTVRHLFLLFLEEDDSSKWFWWRRHTMIWTASTYSLDLLKHGTVISRKPSGW